MAYFNNLIVGGTAKFLQDIKVAGVDTTKEELNYLHTYEEEKEGFPLNSCYYITSHYTEDFAYTPLCVNVEGGIGLQVGKTYTLTLTNYNDEVTTYTAVATDCSSTLGVSGAIKLSFDDDDYEVFDKVHFDILNIDTENEVLLPTSGGYMYTHDMEFNFKEAILTGEGLKHTETVSGAAINEIYPPVEQYCYLNRDIFDETNQMMYFFPAPQGYSRCEIEILITQYNSSTTSGVLLDAAAPYPNSYDSDISLSDKSALLLMQGTKTIGNADTYWMGVGKDYLIGQGFTGNVIHITMLKKSNGIHFTGTANFFAENSVSGETDEGCPEVLVFSGALIPNFFEDVPLIWSPSSPYGFGVYVTAFTRQDGYKQCKITWYKE